MTARVDGHLVRVGTRAYVSGTRTSTSAPHDPAPAAPDPEIRHRGTEGTEGQQAELNRQEPQDGEGFSGPKLLAASAVRSPIDATASAVRPSIDASLSYISIDGTSAGTVAVADVASPDARDAIAKLRAMGIEIVMVTGDREAAAQGIAREVGITKIHAGVRPTAKAAIVAGERWGGHRVAMVGDGINDAPALAAADLGIAIGSGAELAAAAADVTLLRGGIATLPIALQLARATLRTIRRNLIAAFAYNAICIPIAAAGLLSPMLAAAAMSLSSVSVLVSSLRLRRFMCR